MAAFHVFAGADGNVAAPTVRRIEIGDLHECLNAGWDDFLHNPSHVVFIIILYPIIGIVLATWTAGANALPLLFPLASGFAILGPFAALGLYEMSRRREKGGEVSLRDALKVTSSPALPSIAAVGALLLVLFVVWLLVAQGLYVWLMGSEPPVSIAAMLRDVLGTSQGWTLIVVGNAIGFAFALVAFSVAVISFPMLLDRDVGAWTAVTTSVRAVMANPVPMAAWGLIVAALLALGSLPLFAGLVVVLPLLGHATWHLYRKLVASEGTERART